ncbi:MAG: hypothetical protein NZ805_15595 [Armatimonadetes bacterium]|nr:hypothetical protein [Armatimonadota bacterium]MDW8029884.1 hypothetical protein [Armatimonadota bacterium]
MKRREQGEWWRRLEVSSGCILGRDFCDDNERFLVEGENGDCQL